MSENSFVRVREAAIGKEIATREATEGTGRLVQGFDFYSRGLSNLSVLREDVSTADGEDLSLLNEVIVMGDSTLFVVQPKFTSNDGIVRVTPVGYPGGNYILYETKESGMGDIKFEDDFDGKYISPAMVWDAWGVQSIRLHVTYIFGKVTLLGGII